MPNWPFPEPKNMAVFTTARILAKSSPILRVSHDADDGAWQFLDDGELTEEIIRIVGLGSMIKLDSTLLILADLPLGWQAWRMTLAQPWQRNPIPTSML